VEKNNPRMMIAKTRETFECKLEMNIAIAWN
jgi:hypothetical protein